MRLLSLTEIASLHRLVLEASGGSAGIRDLGALEAAVAQPSMSFGGEELYPTILDKAAAVGASIIQNHPFIDGNKRAGHAAMETTLVLNGFELHASVAEQEQVVLALAAGQIDRAAFLAWVSSKAIRRTEPPNPSR